VTPPRSGCPDVAHRPASFLKALIGNQITILESQVWGDGDGAADRTGSLVWRSGTAGRGEPARLHLTEKGGVIPWT